MEKLPHWYELQEPTPLVERGGQWYNDDVPVQPVDVLEFVEVGRQNSRTRYWLKVAMPDGETRRVFGQEVSGFSGRFRVGTQPMLCQVHESEGKLIYILMPVKPQTAVVNPEQPAPTNSLQTTAIDRDDELVCWSITQALRSMPVHGEYWDEDEIRGRSRSILKLYHSLRCEQ